MKMESLWRRCRRELSWSQSFGARGFHLYDKLPHIFPESCLLITLGILVGVTLYFTETASSGQYSLDANTFFLFLLPPIIYDAGYHMPNRAFFNNIGTILLLAVVNTLWNTIGIGVCLWGMSKLGWINSAISLLHCFVFSSLISAVDPVAVLAIFEEIQVNEILYIIVFGESLLNDGVTVVLYHMMDGFTEIGEANLHVVDFVTGFAQFFIVVFGGTFIGIVYGLMGAFITKYTDHVRVLEPLFVFVLGYLAYLTAESMELSGILALTFGGIVMRHYTELNMAKKSTTTVKYFMKMVANISETIIFMFLGLSVVIDSHDFRLDFILFSLLFCLVFRVTGVMMLSWLVNQRRLIRLSAIDQFIMSYGGLRGGIAFCLALLLNADHIPERQMFVTTTTVIVFFTVFIQGITIKPVVNALKVERAEDIDTSMNEMIHKRFIDHLMAGVEDIVGKSGHNSIFQRFDYYNDKFLKPWLLREKPKLRAPGILRTYTRLNMQDAKTVAKAFPVSIPRELSMTNLSAMSRSPSAAQMANMGRRATISVPNSRDMETIINLHSNDPMFQKKMNDESSVLQDNLLGVPRPGYLSERRHTLAEIHNQQPGLSPADSEQLQNFFSSIHRGTSFSNGSNNNNSVSAANNNSNGAVSGFTNSYMGNKDAGAGAANFRPPESPGMGGNKFPAGRRVHKNISFSSPAHKRLTKKLSDVAELHPDAAQEVSVMPNEDSIKEVTFTVGQPALEKKQADKDITEVQKCKESSTSSKQPSTTTSSESTSIQPKNVLVKPELPPTTLVSSQTMNPPTATSMSSASNPSLNATPTPYPSSDSLIPNESQNDPALTQSSTAETHLSIPTSDTASYSFNLPVSPSSDKLLEKLSQLSLPSSSSSSDSDSPAELVTVGGDQAGSPQVAQVLESAPELPQDLRKLVESRERTRSDPIDIPRSESGGFRVRQTSQEQTAEVTCDKVTARDDGKSHSSQENLIKTKGDSDNGSSHSSKADNTSRNNAQCQYKLPECGTLAETSLPWRRKSSVSPVPSSLSQSLPDDEKPLQSEAPSWASNLAYHCLSETGSPFHSPNTTLTATRNSHPPRPVFDLFPASPTEPENNAGPVATSPTEAADYNTPQEVKEEEEEEVVQSDPFFPPPPWSSPTNAGPDDDEEEPQALSSQVMASHTSCGDKAACLLVSGHDLVPPSHHACLDPCTPGGAVSQASSHKHSLASSPLHFLCMEKPQTVTPAAIQAQLIGIQADYHHQMKDRVSQWLATTASSHSDAEEDMELKHRVEEREKIMASLREKRERWPHGHETDEGTDADVESDCDESLDTRNL